MSQVFNAYVASLTEDTTPDIDADFLVTRDTSAATSKKVKPRNLLSLYALLASPAFTGNPTVPTQSPGTNNTRAASTAYVDTAVAAALAGLSWKQAVRVATTAAGTLATSFENGDTVDGVVLATGDRILIKNQATATENGIYVVAASGSPTRATDADAGSELVNASCYVQEGTANQDKQFVCTTNTPITIGATNITFTEFSSGGGVSGPGSSVDNAIARWNGTGGNAIQDYTSGAPTISDTGILTMANALYIQDDVGNDKFGLASGNAGIRFTTGQIVFTTGGARYGQFYQSVGHTIKSDLQYTWSSGSDVYTAGADTGLKRAIAKFCGPTDGSTGAGGFWLKEMTAPSAPAADEVYIYAEDNGSGKTRVMALFSSGAAQQIAIQP